MVNSLLIANLLNSFLPENEIPAKTEEYEGFYHLHRMSGTVSEVQMEYLIRDFDKYKFSNRISRLKACVRILNERFGNCIETDVKYRYKNMLEVIRDNFEIITIASLISETFVSFVSDILFT